jgi:hypothetical protein
MQEVIVDAALRAQSEQVLQLVEDEQSAGAEREPQDHRVRDVARQVPEPEQRDANLDRTHEEREQHGGADLVVRMRVEGADRAQHRDRDRVGGTVDELFRRIEERADGRHDDGRVQTVLDRHPGDERIGLRNRDCCHRQPGNQSARACAGEYERSESRAGMRRRIQRSRMGCRERRGWSCGQQNRLS